MFQLEEAKAKKLTRITDQFSFVDSHKGNLIAEGDPIMPNQRIFIYCKRATCSFETLCSLDTSSKFTILTIEGKNL